MLKCETNTPEMRERIADAFEVSDAHALAGFQDNDFTNVVFEHGQWWVIASNGASWSVVDACGGTSIDGFDFEQVSEGEE